MTVPIRQTLFATALFISSACGLIIEIVATAFYRLGN
tara:strand:- start:142275 stop:142385 length:111 start_codon:yes stop_codon:yes gene_type:complete